MPALNFRAAFAELVASGQKRQTIRAYRRDGRNARPGQSLYLYTGQRSKRCRKIGEEMCSETLRVYIEADVLELDGRECDADEAEEFAKRDGFDGWPFLVDWFERVHGLPFEGLVIRW